MIKQDCWNALEPVGSHDSNPFTPKREEGRAAISLAQYVEIRIRQIFTDIAEGVGNGSIDVGDDPDFVAGVPMAIFKAEMYLIGAWREFMKEDDK